MLGLERAGAAAREAGEKGATAAAAMALEAGKAGPVGVSLRLLLHLEKVEWEMAGTAQLEGLAPGWAAARAAGATAVQSLAVAGPQAEEAMGAAAGEASQAPAGESARAEGEWAQARAVGPALSPLLLQSLALGRQRGVLNLELEKLPEAGAPEGMVCA